MVEILQNIPGYTPGHVGSADRERGLFLAICNTELLLPENTTDNLFWNIDERPRLQSQIIAEHYIGDYLNRPCWVWDIDDCDIAATQCEIRSVRSLLGQCPDKLFQLVGTGMQMIRWLREHAYCGRCGDRTEAIQNETATRCGNCDLLFYPRLAPCAIILVTHGDNCLLARNAGWRKDYYSCVAGYVDPGETLEQTVRREVHEEVGVKIAELRYFGSQPWPFPGQLMLGFHADYKSGEIQPDGVEITDADWFRYDNLPACPNPASLSGKLIQAFVRSRQ